MLQALLTLGLAALALVGSFGPAAQTAPRPASEARDPDVYVSVLGPKNAPVAGLSAADFTVREDNAAREVIQGEWRPIPMQVVLIVDDSQALNDALQPLPRRTHRLCRQTHTGTAKWHSSSSRRSRRRRWSARPPVRWPLKTGINRIFARPGAGARFLDAVMDVSQGFERRKAERPVIVALTMEAGPSQQPALIRTC